MLGLLRNELLLRPVYNTLLLFLELFQWHLWWAIIALTALVRLALSKSTAAGSNMQNQMGSLQPKMQEIQEKYKDDPEQLSKKTMELLKKDWAGPLKWCIWMLIQMPVFFGLYAVVSNIANPTGIQSWMKFPTNVIDMTYSFLYPYVNTMLDTANMVTQFMGINVLEKNNIILAIAWWILMYINTTIMSWTRPAPAASIPWANVPDMSKMMWFMNYFLVFMIGSFIYSVASGIWLYIITSTLFGVIQLYFQQRVLINAKIQTIFKRK